MGFAVIGYPTMRSTRRKMEDQLPSKLRSKKDSKKHKLEVELKIEQERENRRKVEREKARRYRLKQQAMSPEERLKIENKKRLKMEKLKAKRETQKKAKEKARRLALIKERKADFKKRNIQPLSIIMDRNLTYDASHAKFIPTAHLEEFRIHQWMPEDSKDKHSKSLQKKPSTAFGKDQAINSTETERSKSRKRLRERNEDNDSRKSKKSHKSKKHKKSKTEKKSRKDKKKHKKQRKSKKRNIEESLSVVTPSDETMEEDNDTIIDPDFNMEMIRPMGNKILSLSPSKRKQFKKEIKSSSKLSLSKLPLEVLQKIFIFSFANYNLLLTNKYLNHCLRLSDHLLERNLYENYFYSIEEQENDSENKPVTKKYINVNLFKDPNMTKFFFKNFNSLKESFDNFITDKGVEDGGETYETPSLPHIIYVDYVQSFFYDPNVLKFMFQKFRIHVDTLVDHIITWFFSQTHYKIEAFLKVMDDIKEYCQEYDYLKEKVNFTAHHLVTILEYLFLKKEDNPSDYIEFFHGISSIVDGFSTLSLMDLKIKFVDIYLLTFYKFPSSEGETADSDINTILDDSLLWSCLRKISNIELLDMFVARGVRPSYGSII